MSAEKTSAGYVDVLIADDEEPVRWAVRYLLEREGYTCAEAADGREAVELVRHRSPHCVLLDLAMSGLDGFAVARQLRAEPPTRPLHIHCLTSLTDPVTRRRASEAGCETILAKPVDAATLLTVVGRDVKQAEAPWVSGLTKTQAEDLLDWLQANGYPPAELSCRKEGFAVRCPGFRMRKSEGE
jgi:CheY-like chemotaxis protein